MLETPGDSLGAVFCLSYHPSHWMLRSGVTYNNPYLDRLRINDVGK